MAASRITVFRRRPVRRAYTTRRRYGRKRYVGSGITTVKASETVLHDCGAAGTTSGSSITKAFRLQQITNYTDYGTQYDRYRITNITVKITPTYSEALQANANMLEAIMAFDPNDINGVTRAAMTERKSCYRFVNKTTYFKFKPTIPFDISGTTAAGSMTGTPWLSVANGAAVYYYGFKAWIGSVSGDNLPNPAKIRIDYIYTIQFKGQL